MGKRRIRVDRDEVTLLVAIKPHLDDNGAPKLHKPSGAPLVSVDVLIPADAEEPSDIWAVRVPAPAVPKDLVPFERVHFSNLKGKEWATDNGKGISFTADSASQRTANTKATP